MKLIFDDCLKMVGEADIVVAVLDGPDAYFLRSLKVVPEFLLL